MTASLCVCVLLICRDDYGSRTVTRLFGSSGSIPFRFTSFYDAHSSVMVNQLRAPTAWLFLFVELPFVFLSSMSTERVQS
jgi:hypothetical protein